MTSPRRSRARCSNQKDRLAELPGAQCLRVDLICPQARQLSHVSLRRHFDSPYGFGFSCKRSTARARRAVDDSRDHQLTLRLPFHRRAVLHGVNSLSLLASIDFLLPFQFLNNFVQLVEA
jgi:hypothetical protein